MKCREKFFLSALVLCGVASTQVQAVTPYFGIRSQGTSAVREMLGWQKLINRCDEEDFYGAGSLALEYSQSFRSNRIAECLFGDALVTIPAATTPTTPTTGCDTGCDSNNGCNSRSIVISGSCVDDRNNDTDFLADYFGLPTDFQSTVSFSPKIRNFVADFEFYMGLSEWACGLYFRLNLPLNYTRWDLNFCESITNAGTNPYLPGYFGPTLVPTSDLLHSAEDFFAGRTPTLSDGITFQGLKYSKWAGDCKSKTKTRLADVEAVLGYNFACSEDYNFGINIRTAAPAGNRPEGEFLFEPMSGNGKHWELGAGINTSAVLWRACDSDTTFSVYLDANVMHLFDACQTRVFDLCSAGDNSRYMLAQRLGTNNNTLQGGTPLVLSDSQFANEFAPVANLTASRVDVSVPVVGNVAIKFAFDTDCGFGFDVGYEFFGSACEKVCRKNSCNNNDVTLTDWALKGDAHVVGFLPVDGGSAPINLAATQSTATISHGTNFPGVDCTFVDSSNSVATGALLAATANPRIDNVQPAFSDGDPLFAQPFPDFGPQTNTSIQPITLTEDDINVVTNRNITHKVFAHFNYTWQDREECQWIPFVGVGASAEFASRGGNCDTTACDVATICGTENTCDSDDRSNCTSCSSLNQWSVWIKGGFAY